MYFVFLFVFFSGKRFFIDVGFENVFLFVKRRREFLIGRLRLDSFGGGRFKGRRNSF